MSSFYLPMTDCSACNRHVGHLYEPYYTLTERLLRLLSTSTSIAEFAESIRDGDFTYDGHNIAQFLRVYYTWAAKNPAKALFEPANVVARALLSIRELKEAHLPFGSKAADGQRNAYDAPICCLRMFQCDPSMQTV
jgi:hypothetical protein